MIRSIPKHELSKSTFMYGLQCIKKLWLNKYLKSEREVPDAMQVSIFQQGTDVGILAQQLFPGGIDAKPENYFSYQQSVADTMNYIRKGHLIIYEAAFQFNGVLCALDILVKNNNKWYAFEVKGTNSVKEPHILDAALQYYVITNAGIDLEDFSIIHLNRDYKRKGELDIQQLFTIDSVLKQVKGKQENIAGYTQIFREVLKQPAAPDIRMGAHCNKPYPCDFQKYCSKGLLIETPDYGEKVINKKAIRAFTNSLVYPLYFMDFESWMTAIPEYDGHWPFKNINFQFSVHKVETPGNEPLHFSYLAKGPHSPQREFINSLLPIIGNEGSILVYNQSFEKQRLEEMKNDYPDIAELIKSIQERIVDLMPLFEKNYRLPEMEGSFSLKKVLPAIVPELNYESLSIKDGAVASASFYNLKNERNPEKIKEVREALTLYCGMDTLSMVKIVEKLREI
jgi:hypothetical protein